MTHDSAWDLVVAAVAAVARIYEPGAIAWGERVARPAIADPVIDQVAWPAGHGEMRARLLVWYREHEALSTAYRVARDDYRQMCPGGSI